MYIDRRGNFVVYDSKWTDELKYCVYFVKYKNILFDCFIAKSLGITLEEYRSILKSYNAIVNEFRNYSHFENKDDAFRCAEFLDEKYGIIGELIGYIV